jgi:hypothetical protein
MYRGKQLACVDLRLFAGTLTRVPPALLAPRSVEPLFYRLSKGGRGMAITKRKFIGMTSATAAAGEASVLHELGILAFQRGDIESR